MRRPQLVSGARWQRGSRVLLQPPYGASPSYPDSFPRSVKPSLVLQDFAVLAEERQEAGSGSSGCADIALFGSPLYLLLAVIYMLLVLVAFVQSFRLFEAGKVKPREQFS